MLYQILSHVPPLHRLNAGLACWQWQQVADTLLEDVQFTVRGPRTPGDYGKWNLMGFKRITIQEAATLLLRSNRPFSRFAFGKMDVDDAVVDFLNCLGPRLLHLRWVWPETVLQKDTKILFIGMICFILQ